MPDSLFSFVTFFSFYIALLFLALCVACGLYYIGELAEEYSIRTRRTLLAVLVMVAVIYLLLAIVDGISPWRCVMSFIHQGIYSLLLRRFPWVSLTSPSFILSIYAFVADHCMWYSYFLGEVGRQEYTRLVGFFFLMVWAVPFILFVTLNVEEQYLPGTSSMSASRQGFSEMAAGGKSRRGIRGMLHSVFGSLRGNRKGNE